MHTNERSHVSYSVVNEIVHTEGDGCLCAQFNNGFTEIVKSFERDKTDNEQITDAIKTYCSSDLLPGTFSIGRAYIVKREVTYYKYFAPDTITTLAEQKVQYEKHKKYINSPEGKTKSREISYYIAVPYAATSKHDIGCYTIPLNSAVLEYHIKTSSIYVNSKYAEYETAYNKMRNNNIRWKLNNPTSDFEIILEDLNLKDAIINNFQRWLTNTKQDSIPKINSTSRVLNEAAFRISRFINRTKYGQDSNFKNFLCASDIPIVSSGDPSLDYGVVPKFEMSVKDIQNGDEVSIIKQIQKYYNGDELLFSWKWDTAVELSYLNSIATYTDGNYILKGYYNIEIINVKEKTYMMRMINPVIREICNDLSIGAFNHGIYYETTRDTPNQPTSTSFISALDGVYIRFMDKAFQVYINEDTTEVVLYSKTRNVYIPAHVVFDSMINNCPKLVKYFNSQEKLMTSTNPYSDIKWGDIVPWVRDSIFKTTIDRPEKKTIEELENPNFIFDTEIKCDDLTRAFMAPLLMGNTATEQIANKILEDKLTLGNKMYSSSIVENRNLLQEYDEESGEIWTEDTTSICGPMDLLKTHVGDSIECSFLFRIENHNNKTYLSRPTYPLPVKYSDFDGTQRTRTITAFSCGIYYKPNYDYMKNAINVATFQGDKYYLIPGTVISYLGKEIAMCINGRTNEVVKMGEAYNSYIPMSAYFETLHMSVETEEQINSVVVDGIEVDNGCEEVTEENYFIKVEYALKENNPFGATSAKEMFTLEVIASMQITTILLSNYIEYTKTHNEKIVKIKDGTIQSRLDNTPHQLYMHKDTQEMYVQNGEFSFLPAAPFFVEKEEKIMDKQDDDNIDQYNIECEQGEHGVHIAMDNNLFPERWDARDYHINHAQVAANVATADTLEESRHINHSKQFNDYCQRYTSNQVKQTTINNIMIGM